MNNTQRSKNIERNVREFMKNLTREDGFAFTRAVMNSDQPADVKRAFLAEHLKAHKNKRFD